MTPTYTLQDLRLIELASPACREQLYAAIDRAGLPRPDLGPINSSPPSTRSTNLCQDGEHDTCHRSRLVMAARPTFRCRCLCHQATNADAGRVPA